MGIKVEQVDTLDLYQEERISLNEKNDCVVRAVAITRGVTYQSAHDWCRLVFDRKPRGRVHTAHNMAHSWANGNLLSQCMLPFRVGNNVHWRDYQNVIMCSHYENVQGREAHLDSVADILPIKSRCLTVRGFLREVALPDGKYILLVKGHAIAVVNGVVYDDPNSRLSSRVQFGWKVK